MRCRNLLACAMGVLLLGFSPERAEACEVRYLGIQYSYVFLTNSMTDPCSWLFFGLTTVGSASTPRRWVDSESDYKIPYANGDIYASLWYNHMGHQPFSMHCVSGSYYNYYFGLSSDNPRNILAPVVETISSYKGPLCYYPGFW